jgi:hypothetical protein
MQGEDAVRRKQSDPWVGVRQCGSPAGQRHGNIVPSRVGRIVGEGNWQRHESTVRKMYESTFTMNLYIKAAALSNKIG